MTRPINPTDPGELKNPHLIVANNGEQFAIYAKDPSGSSPDGRIFLSVEEIKAIISTFTVKVIEQELDTIENLQTEFSLNIQNGTDALELIK